MIKAGIVGLGWWGKTLVESAESSDAIQFVAGTTRTITPEIEAFAKQKGLHLTASYDNMLHHAGVDAVVLATPHSMHATQVIAAAAAGKHVYCEKPFTLTKREAEDATAAVRKAGVTLAVGYNRRFHPEMGKLREMIRAGELGAILHVEATMTFANVLSINPKHWRADRAETPLGGLMPMGVHAIDAMIELCGPIDHVFAQSFRRAAPIDADSATVAIKQKNLPLIVLCIKALSIALKRSSRSQASIYHHHFSRQLLLCRNYYGSPERIIITRRYHLIRNLRISTIPQVCAGLIRQLRAPRQAGLLLSGKWIWISAVSRRLGAVLAFGVLAPPGSPWRAEVASSQRHRRYNNPCNSLPAGKDERWTSPVVT